MWSKLSYVAVHHHPRRRHSLSDHYSGVIMGTMASRITSLTIVYSTIYSPVNSPHKGQWRGALVLFFIWAWVNNREAGDLRCHGAHYDVTVMRGSYIKFNFYKKCKNMTSVKDTAYIYIYIYITLAFITYPCLKGVPDVSVCYMFKICARCRNLSWIAFR